MEEKTKVAIYIRVCCKNDKEVKEQERELRAYCKVKDYMIHDVYIDNGFSGRTSNRPAYCKMLGDFWDKKFNKVLVYKISELSRNLSELSCRLDLFNSTCVAFESLKENICSSNPVGKAFTDIVTLIGKVCEENVF